MVRMGTPPGLKGLQAYVTEHQQELYRLAYSYTRSREDALDAVQEAVLKAIDKISTLRDPERLRVWLTRILVNECLTRLRRRRPAVPLEDWQEPAVPERDQDELWDLRRALAELDPKLRTVVVLRFFEDMKLEEISQVMGLPLSTVKSRLYRALAALRLDLSGREELT